MSERFLTAPLPWNRFFLVPPTPCAEQALTLLPKMQLLIVGADLIVPSMAFDLSIISSKGIALGVFSDKALALSGEPLATAGLAEYMFNFIIEGDIPITEALERLVSDHGAVPSKTWIVSSDRVNEITIPQQRGFNTIWVTDLPNGDPTLDTIQTRSVSGLFRLLAT